MIQCSDDTEAALPKWLKGYPDESEPILSHYSPKGIVKRVNGNQGIIKVSKDTCDAIGVLSTGTS